MSGDMAHHVEPLDIDCNSDFDNKENTFNHNNALPCTEKGYEELDVSELNMKLRYSVTPTASPMSKSYTNCTDNRNFDSDETFNYTLNESNLTRSLNSTVTKNENVIKSLKNLPLQSLSIDKKFEKNNSSMGKSESAIISECNNITVTINGTSDIDDNISSSSTTSSVLHTPEATTPTKEISKTDGGSPILRGLKSVLNMFRSSQSPITPADDNSSADKHTTSTPTEGVQTKPADKPQAIASTPIATSRLKESNGSRRSSPYKDSIVFNDDLEKELQWKDETTIIFSHEKIPVHKLFFQQTKTIPKNEANQIASNMENKTEEDYRRLNTAVETTDITYNKSVMGDKIIPAMQEDILKNENYASNDSDSEFLDCETTLVNNEANTTENMEKELKNDKNFQDTCSTFDLEEDNNKSINFKQEYIDSNMEVMVTTEPTELIQNIEYNKSLHMMIDSLDDNVNEKLSVTEFKTYDNLEADDNILQLDNTRIVNQNNISISKLKLENSICSEYDMDSLEYNFMNKTNDIDVINNNNDIITNSLQELTMHETKAGNGVINSSNLTLPTEIPLPDEDNSKIELNTIGTNILTSDSVCHNIIANSEVKSTLNEITELKIISNTSCNVILEENISSAKKESNNDFLIKNEEHEMNSYSKIQEEIYIIEGPSKETIHSSVENNNVVVTQALIDHKGTELFDNLDTSKLCENNKINLTCPNSDSLCENFTKLEIHTRTDQDNLEFPCDSQIIKNVDKDMKFVPVHENVENDTDKENHRKSPDGAHSLDEIIVNNQIDLDNSNTNKNKVESNLANVHEELFLKKPTKDTITILGTKENIEDKQILSNLLNINNKDNIDIVENDGNHERLIENTEIVLTDSLPVKLNCSENIGNFEINLDANKKQLKEINEKDCNTGTLAGSTDCNEYHNINVVSEYLNSSNTFTDKTVVDQNTDALASISNSLKEGNENDKNDTVEQAKASSNELQSDKTIQRENEYIKEKQIKELTMNETTTSDINLTTNHIDDETLESNTILLKKVTENDPSHIKCEVSNDKFENLIEEKTENINLQSSKEVIIDANFTHNGKCLDEDENVNELDTFTLDEEIVLSENNSPYVSVSEDLNKVSIEQTTETFAQTENANTTITITNSPPITSKGYNFNFDEIEDPFASETSQGMSSTNKNKSQNIESTINSINLDQAQTPRKVSVNDRRKIQSERKKKIIAQKKFNNTFSIDTAESETLTNEEKLDYSFSIKDNANTKKFITDTIQTNIDGNLTVNNDKTFLSNNSDKTKDSEVLDPSNNISSPMNGKTSMTSEGSEVNKLSVVSITAVSSSDNKNASSSDQSCYCSVNTSLDENIKSRNVFNIPELHDMNFNQCVVKSKLSQTPPPDFDKDNPFVTRSKLSISPGTNMIPHTNIEPHIIDSMHKLANRDCEDKMETEPMEKVSSVNRSSDTCSSNASEKDITVKEIDTEDEDTIEGPFLDDLNADEMSCLGSENVDMMNFNDVPNQENEDNADGEIFIDAEAFQFLLNQNKSNVVADSGKESLFLKFDPLFAKRISSDSVITALSKIQNRQSTPMKISKQQNITLATDSSSTLNESCNKDNNITMETNTDNLNVTISKPMMVVPPAVNAIATPRKSQTPTRTNRLSGTFTSPAMAVIDRLLSLSANNSLVEHEATFTQVSREQNEANLALTQLRELLAEKEIHVYNLRSESRDLKDRLITLESHMSALEAESQQRLKRIEELTETLSKRSSMDRNMAVVFEEYESTIANLIAQIEKEKKQHADERAALIKERNEQTAHLTNMEVSFNDLHSKYEKIKQVIANYKSNEESYKKTLMIYEENFTKAQNNYELLKQHATSKLNYANEELQKINKSHEAEVLKMNAMIKRKDLHITSLEETLAQKTKANEELTAICDELINKVG